MPPTLKHSLSINEDSIHQFLRNAAEPDLDETALESALDAAAHNAQPLPDETIKRMMRDATTQNSHTRPKTNR